MKIEFHKVTWYSKIFALALFALLPFAGFVFGAWYGGLVTRINDTAIFESARNQGNTALPAYYQNISEWQTARRDDAGFSIAYPLDFVTNDIYAQQPTAEWSVSTNGLPGTLVMTLTIPKVFEPQTNFNEARLTVGRSGNANAVSLCAVSPAPGIPGSYATATINRVLFSVYHFSDAGAGNLYDTTSYRTVHNGQCYAVEYTIHSSQIANYPSEYHLQPFDAGRLKQVLNRIVETFRFTN